MDFSRAESLSFESNDKTTTTVHYENGVQVNDYRNEVKGKWMKWQPPEFLCESLLAFTCLPRKTIQQLADKAETEYWGENNWGLRQYIDYTFRRVFEEGKILGFFPDSRDEPTVVVWSTGLLTPNVNDIYCLMVPFHKKQQSSESIDHMVEQLLLDDDKSEIESVIASLNEPSSQLKDLKWYAKNWVITQNLRNKELMAKHNVISMNELPERAMYFVEEDRTAYERAVYNATIPMKIEDVNLEHFSIRRERLPRKYHNISNRELAARFQKGIIDTLTRAKANPRCGVPQWFRDKNNRSGELQLLLPINLDFGYDPDCAVAVKIEYDASTNQPHYQVRSFLDKAQAYFNARVLQKNDQDWLKPADYLQQPPFFRQVPQDISSDRGDQEFGNMAHYSNSVEYTPNYTSDVYKTSPATGGHSKDEVYYVGFKEQPTHGFRFNTGVVNANYNKPQQQQHNPSINSSMNQFFAKNYSNNTSKRSDSRFFKTS